MMLVWHCGVAVCTPLTQIISAYINTCVWHLLLVWTTSSLKTWSWTRISRCLVCTDTRFSCFGLCRRAFFFFFFLNKNLRWSPLVSEASWKLPLIYLIEFMNSCVIVVVIFGCHCLKWTLWLRLSAGLVEGRESPGERVIFSRVTSTLFESFAVKRKVQLRCVMSS